MGQKVSPHGLRVGVIKDWDSKWYADKSKFADYLVEDNKVRDFVKKKLYVAGVSKIVLERAAENKLKVIVLTAKPGMVIGRSGTGIEDLKSELEKMTGKTIIIDGFIMTNCILAASKLHPEVLEYCVFGHQGDEAGHKSVLEALHAKPLLNLGLRLGEGTGAICAYPIIESAIRMINEMSSFKQAAVTKYF